MAVCLSFVPNANNAGAINTPNLQRLIVTHHAVLKKIGGVALIAMILLAA